MSYAKEKAIVEKKVKRLKGIAAAVVAFLVVTLCVLGSFYYPSSWRYHFALPRVGTRAEGEMRLHFIDVGQGDCSLIELPDGKIMLIDGGDEREQTATVVLQYLNALDVDVIDYLLVTHADTDHCGSLAKVLEEKKIKRAFLPVANATDNNAYAEFYTALLREEDCVFEYSSRSILLNGEGKTAYTLSFLYPYTIDVENIGENSSKDGENNKNSSVFWLDYQGVSALFTGDAPLSTEPLLQRDSRLGLFENRGVDLESTEILKVSHHGSRYSTSKEFVDFLGVETAVISCGKDNTYGHPSSEVCENLTAVGAKTYRTDEQGSVIVTVKANGAYEVKTLGKN